MPRFSSTLHIWMVWASSRMKQEASAIVAIIRKMKYTPLVIRRLPEFESPHFLTRLVLTSQVRWQSGFRPRIFSSFSSFVMQGSESVKKEISALPHLSFPAIT